MKVNNIRPVHYDTIILEIVLDLLNVLLRLYLPTPACTNRLTKVRVE